MPTIGTSSKPAYVYDAGTDTWIPIGPGEHTHAYVEKSTLTTTGDLVYASAANTPARLGIGSTGQVLTVSGGVPAWGAPAGKTWTSVASGNISTGVSTQTFSGLTAYDDYVIMIYDIVTSADNKTFELTINNTTSYYGWGCYTQAYDNRGTSNAGAGNGFRLSTLNIIGTAVSDSFLRIEGAKSSGVKVFEYYSNSGYLSQTNFTKGYTNSSAALSSLTITTNGTFNGGNYIIYGA